MNAESAKQTVEEGGEEAAHASWFDRTALFASALVPALVVALESPRDVDAAHDPGAVRALAYGWTGAWRSLDAIVASLGAVLPIGTRATRANITGALVLAVCGAVLYRTTRALLERCADAGRLGSALALATTCAALSSAPWLFEATASGGSALGALLVLAPLGILAARGKLHNTRIVALFLSLGAAFAYEPLVFGAALAGVAPFLIFSADARPSMKDLRRLAPELAVAFAMGALPFVIAFARARARPELALDLDPWSAWRGEGTRSFLSPLVLARAELGLAVLTFVAAGAIFCALVPRARPLGASIAIVAIFGAIAMLTGAPAGPDRFSAPLLASLAAAYALVAVALSAFVRYVARAKIPFAGASAAMLVVLAFTIPARSVDDALTRRDARSPDALATWDDAAWGSIAPGAVVLMSDRRAYLRVLASRAEGTFRGDLVVVPAFDVGALVAREALAGEPLLAGYYRDIALTGTPDEWSLAQIAASRPLVVSFDPKWDRSLARHLVPAGLSTEFEPEPRGQSERKKAFDQFVPMRARLAKELSGRDATLAALTAEELRARALAMAATGERESVAHALDDLRPFAPDDPVAAQIVRRLITQKGVIDVHDLAP